MPSIHPGRKVPWVFGIEGIADHRFPKPVRAALLEVVTVRDAMIVMTSATSLPGTVGQFAIRGERISIEPLQDDFFMQEDLRGNGGWMQKAAAQHHDDSPKESLIDFHPAFPEK
jgi:hypothetical protein